MDHEPYLFCDAPLPSKPVDGYFEWVMEGREHHAEKHLLTGVEGRPRWLAVKQRVGYRTVALSVLVRDGWTLVWCYLSPDWSARSLAVVAGGAAWAASDSVSGRLAMSFVRRKRAAVEAAAAVQAVPLEGHAKKMPALMEHLTRLVHEDSGEVRETTTLTLFAEGGVFKVFANSRDTGESLCVSAASWEGLWTALEKALTDPGASWRPMRDKAPGKRPSR